GQLRMRAQPDRCDLKLAVGRRAGGAGHVTRQRDYAATPRPLPERPWVGVNFWSRAGGPRMWDERYAPEVVRQELDVLAANGCNVTRSFCYWPDFMPEPERLDPAALER